ncbi:hypothetical protein BDV26DRAFT_285167 [Aspergillus bertholletiae]|uniref:Xylanolytic transcriptional activator regulatory domain-containing protein n=1 Tax=Aspergillus bertholletiae TaxID=1226010 RepID=A0A5N7AU65_9EURO|nr:hypothetical protein BDV26DRAFT_285167 [Aspergillus bertholletiae]
MTRPRDGQNHAPRSTKQLGASTGAQSLSTPTNAQHSPGANLLSSSSSTTRIIPSAEIEFFGSTAFPAIINDDQDIVNRYVGQFCDQSILQFCNADRSQEHISEKQIHEGRTVLNLLVNFPAFTDCIHRYLELSYTCMVPDPFIKACVLSIQETILGLKGSRLRQLAVDLFVNTSKPLNLFTPVPAKDYHTLFTGPNLRWEIIGFVLAILGISLKYDVNKQNASPRSLPPDKSDFIHRIAEAVEYCTSVCYSYTCVSHQALWLLYGDACLKNLVYGDMSFQFWRCMGDLSSMFFALGLHHENVKFEETHPFYQLEMRRRYAAQIYSMDKTISTILGRPPRISGSHCANIMPADIDDGVLLLEGDELYSSLRNVDANGWNMDRQFRGATWRRIKLIVSQFREEVLGVCLRTHFTDDSEILAQDILTRHEIVWDQIPQELKYDELTRSLHIPPPQRYVVMTTYMDQKYNCFLLHRKLVNETHWMREPLYKASISLLNTVLQVVSLSDQVYNMQRDISWSTLYYGLPGASTLAVDLLKDLHHISSIPNSQIDVIPRAEVIQNLAIFIANLQKSINRREVNQKPCKWAHAILSGILGEIIDPKNREPTTRETVESQTAANIQFSPNSGLDSDSFNFDDFFSRIGSGDLALDTSAIML